jgi:hypothetical protein
MRVPSLEVNIKIFNRPLMHCYGITMYLCTYVQLYISNSANELICGGKKFLLVSAGIFC